MNNPWKEENDAKKDAEYIKVAQGNLPLYLEEIRKHSMDDIKAWAMSVLTVAQHPMYQGHFLSKLSGAAVALVLAAHSKLLEVKHGGETGKRNCDSSSPRSEGTSHEF